MEDWADSLPPDVRRQLAEDVTTADSTPPPSGDRAAEPSPYSEERVHSSDLILEPESERGESTPVVHWLRGIPPALPRQPS